MNDKDIIKELPDELLLHILLFLSTYEAVGSACLSKRWRYLHPELRNLDFVFDHDYIIRWSYRSSGRHNIYQFWAFISCLIFLLLEFLWV